MGLITFLTDFQTKDHYIASVKAKILSENPAAQIVDITHNINMYDIAHAAFVLNSCYKDFPKGTIHLIDVHSLSKHIKGFFAVKIKGHFFISADNGIFSLLDENDPEEIVELPYEGVNSFPGRDILAPAAAALANGKVLKDLGKAAKEVQRMLNRELRITEDAIIGNVAHVDHYGNLITNIRSDVFEMTRRNRNFTIKIGREHMDKIDPFYNSVGEGDSVAIFNSNHFLEIAINQGNAAELLGVRYDSSVSIQFGGQAFGIL
jgi:S-adenosylmethionine hydrolase